MIAYPSKTRSPAPQILPRLRFENRRQGIAPLITRLKDRRRRRRQAKLARTLKGERVHMRKRKIALAMSVSAAGIQAAASGAVEPRFSSSAQQAWMIETRTQTDSMRASAELKRAMMEEEGVRHDVYRDVAGNLTVGVGHLVTASDGLSLGDTISDERVMELLEADLEHAEKTVSDLVGDLPLFQHEFDALVDLVFNVGQGSVSQERSPKLNEAISAGDHQSIADELHYHSAGGATAKGLIYRSERRANIFLNGSYEDPRMTA
ncbi:lysozyme [Pontixanthobacter luteolus]|uniref:lysozyme n=1 Tax=Pontixanthobacter luteolus TaxID=295089 RepID=UPI0023028E94|nr:lysozyme [Pontixanthobacter luteolus]